MDVNDLINPLRYVNLKEIDPQSINRMGEGVFPEPGTLDHLRIIDLVTKAYQGVHLPTFGHPIPQSTRSVTATQTTTEANLITASNNETLEILSISSALYFGDSLSAGSLHIYSANDATTSPFMDLPEIDNLIVSFSGIVYGHVVDLTNTNKATIAPSPLLLTGGESLSIKTKNAPSTGDTLTWKILYRKVAQ